MAVTMYQIARECGLSAPTVSQILNDKGHRYRQTTRQLVIETAERLGYRPNSSARAIATGRFGAVGLMVSTQTDTSITTRAVRGVQQALRPFNMHLNLAEIPTLDDAESEGHVPKLLRELSVDGLLITGSQTSPPRLIELLSKYNLPSIWINMKLDADAVYPDDFGAGRMGTEHLLAAGHRRIAYVTITAGPHYSCADRMEGYVASMRHAGLSPRTIVPEQTESLAELRQQARRLFSQPDRPTAVFTYAIEEALCLQYTAVEMGLKVPGDLSVLTIEDHPVTELGVTMDTLLIPNDRVGSEAVSMLMAKIENPRTELDSRPIPFTLHKGQTVGPVKS